ncbi:MULTISPECIES: hypothetical protein [unclassified Arenibacter]|uniref:hypothetical protein n=1 Tax=unclassified Arenibacter TaxID=2615047 RepID=UPI001C6F1E4A|nr:MULTISPECIES: hypothetical protein [unclassified Arenibacter]
MRKEEYSYIIVESYKPKVNNGYHGDIHIKPIPGQEPYIEEMHVACSKVLSEEYPVGTKFKIKAKITNKEGGKPFAYCHYSWPFEVLGQ